MLKKGLAWHYVAYDKRMVLAKVSSVKLCYCIYTTIYKVSFYIVVLM